MRVQIVDDNKKFRETLRKFILHLTNDIIECDNGRDAVNAYASSRPDLVLMDIKMPIMDGLIATRSIMQKFPDAKIILITDYNVSSYLHIAAKAGAMAFFSKENLTEVKEFISKNIINKQQI